MIGHLVPKDLEEDIIFDSEGDITKPCYTQVSFADGAIGSTAYDPDPWGLAAEYEYWRWHRGGIEALQARALASIACERLDDMENDARGLFKEMKV